MNEENLDQGEGGINQTGTVTVIENEADLVFSSSGADRQIMVIKESWDYMPVDRVEVPGDVVKDIDTVHLQERTEQLGINTKIIFSIIFI